jgi:hypothetical protein
MKPQIGHRSASAAHRLNAVRRNVANSAPVGLSDTPPADKPVLPHMTETLNLHADDLHDVLTRLWGLRNRLHCVPDPTEGDTGPIFPEGTIGEHWKAIHQIKTMIEEFREVVGDLTGLS